MLEKQKITIETTVNAPVQKVWDYFNDPKHIVVWGTASDDWHTPRAENDIRVGGKFNYRMEAKDGSAGFDFTGTYNEVVPGRKIAYTMGDDRKVEVVFEEKDAKTHTTETFEAESENTIEKQRSGWQAILDNFKKHVEAF